jgi:hypothetical protein
MKSFSTIGILVIMLIIPMVLFFVVVLAGNYYPFYFDEAIYLTGGKLFYETTSVKSVFIFEEARSLIGGFGWYGPMYNMLYGLLPKIFGWSSVSNLWIHLILYGTIIYILGFSDWLKLLDKKVLLLGFLCSYAVVPFLFSYFPELLHVLFGIVLFVFLMRAHQSRQSFMMFVLLVCLFTLFRVTFIFALWALVPLKITQVSSLKKYAVLVMVFLLGMLYYKYFHAKPSIAGLGDIFSFESHDTTAIIKTVKTNLHSNVLLFFGFFKSWPKGMDSIVACLFLGILVLFMAFNSNGIQKAQIVGVLLLSIMLVLVWLAFYSVKPFFLEKQFTWLFTLLLLVVVQEKKYHRLLVWVWVVFFLPFTVYRVYDTIEKRTYSSNLTTNQKKLLPNVDEALARLPIEKETNILFAFNDYPVLSHLAYSFFPLSVNGHSMLYTSNLRFKRKHPLNYILRSYFPVLRE